MSRYDADAPPHRLRGHRFSSIRSAPCPQCERPTIWKVGVPRVRCGRCDAVLGVYLVDAEFFGWVQEEAVEPEAPPDDGQIPIF